MLVKTVEYLNKQAKICFPNKYRNSASGHPRFLVVIVYAEDDERCMKYFKIKFDLKSLTGE